jgi:hypothetical protein
MTPRQPDASPAVATRPARPIAVRTHVHDAGLDVLLADPGLSSTAKAIAVALARHWAWGNKDHCWPSDASIAAAVGKSIGHARRCLRELESCGYVRRERSDQVANGRILRLLWRCTAAAAAGARQDLAPARVELERPRAPKEVVIVNREIEPKSDPDPRQRPAPSAIPTPTPAAPRPTPAAIAAGTALSAEEAARLEALSPATRERVLAWVASGDRVLLAEARKLLTPPRPRPTPPATLPELLSRVTEDPAFVPMAAHALADEFGDQKSVAGFKARLEEAWRGERPAEALVDAFRQASGPKARNPGAVFMHALRRPGPG